MDQFAMNQNYREDCSDEYPEDMKLDAERLAGVITRVRDLYRHRVSIRMIDAQSPMGLWKQIRHRFAQLPGFVVDGTLVCSGCDAAKLESLIDRQISRAADRMAAEGAQSAGS